MLPSMINSSDHYSRIGNQCKLRGEEYLETQFTSLNLNCFFLHIVIQDQKCQAFFRYKIKRKFYISKEKKRKSCHFLNLIMLIYNWKLCPRLKKTQFHLLLLLKCLSYFRDSTELQRKCFGHTKPGLSVQFFAIFGCSTFHQKKQLTQFVLILKHL